MLLARDTCCNNRVTVRVECACQSRESRPGICRDMRLSETNDAKTVQWGKRRGVKNIAAFSAGKSGAGSEEARVQVHLVSQAKGGGDKSQGQMQSF